MIISVRIGFSWILPVALFLAATAWNPSPEIAQGREEIFGVVRDTAGSPLSGATVRALQDGRTLAGTQTDAGGAFRLALPRVDDREPVTVAVHRLGYHPEERRVTLDESPIEFRLSPAPLPLPGMLVDGGPVRCEGDDPEGVARAIWRAAAERHPSGLDTLGAASYMLARADTLETGVSPGALVDAVATPGQRGSAPILRIGWSRRIERDGYAFPVRRTDRSGSFASWSYAPLEADFAPHFGSAQFGERHYLQLVSDHADGWTLRFCARNTRLPHLEGRLEVGRDSLIRRVEWRFQTPEPDEEAAGWALFPPAGPGSSPPPLLPVESLTRKTLHDGSTVRRAHWFEGWILAPGDSVPFLPRRATPPVAEPGIFQDAVGKVEGSSWQP